MTNNLYQKSGPIPLPSIGRVAADLAAAAGRLAAVDMVAADTVVVGTVAAADGVPADMTVAGRIVDNSDTRRPARFGNQNGAGRPKQHLRTDASLRYLGSRLSE